MSISKRCCIWGPLPLQFLLSQSQRSQKALKDRIVNFDLFLQLTIQTQKMPIEQR